LDAIAAFSTSKILRANIEYRRVHPVVP
jgi:hypothetical protein